MVEVVSRALLDRPLTAPTQLDPALAVEQIIAAASSAAGHGRSERVAAYETAQRQLRQLLDQTED